MNYNLITILGPTATGKTRLASKLAKHFNGEIISADSRQVYKGMDIGTGKDLSDYMVDDIKIPYHIIDITDPENEFNLYEFILQFKKAYREILDKDKIPFLVGGTGLYLSSIIQGYQIKKADYSEEKINQLNEQSFDKLKSILLKIKPKLHNTTDLENKERIIKAILVAKSEGEVLLKDFKLKSLTIGVKFERSEIRERITERLKKRLSESMIEEVQSLIDSGVSKERLLSLGLEYKFITQYLMESLSYEEMFNKLNTAIHAFAKRQMTWFRKMEREGVKINWIEKGNLEKSVELISKNIYVPDLNL